MSDNATTTETQAKRASLFTSIRKEFGRTQAELATALGISTKAVQSYEQGWRRLPTKVLIQLFVLLAIFRSRNHDKVPCWETVDCPDAKRASCPSYTIGDGQFCWFVAAKSCKPDPAFSEDGAGGGFPCMHCAVIQRLLKSSPIPSIGAEDRQA